MKKSLKGKGIRKKRGKALWLKTGGSSGIDLGPGGLKCGIRFDGSSTCGGAFAQNRHDAMDGEP